MKSKNFFRWLLDELEVTAYPPFGNPDTEVYVLSDDMAEISIYPTYVIENLGSHQNALVIASGSPPTTIVLLRVDVNGAALRWGYDTFSNVVYASYESWGMPYVLKEETPDD
jgi:hypothetical protein